MNTQLINELTTYVKDLRSNYELRLAQEFQKGYSIKQMQIEGEKP
jgi:hypothetical protein